MKRIISYLLLLSFALAFTACREKEPQPPVSQMKGVFYAGAPDLEEVIEIVPGKSKTVDVQAYAEAVSDLVLNLTLKVDPDGAAAYNSAHGTNYQMCPGSAYEFTTNKVLMPRYGKASTSAKLKISASGMEEDVIYVVPVTIDEVIGTDNWERSSSPYAYVLVKRAYVAPDAGSGTKNDPYNLYTAADMLKMSELLVPGTKVYFRMKADIDMEGIDWVPLNFASPYDNCVDFDGAGHTISNFTSTFANYPSFFGVLYGNVHDVTFANAVIESAVGGATGIIGSYCGTTVSGVLKAGEAHRVHVQGRVTSPGGNKNGTGALFGRICGANITACSADVEIESGEDYRLQGGRHRRRLHQGRLRNVQLLLADDGRRFLPVCRHPRPCEPGPEERQHDQHPEQPCRGLYRLERRDQVPGDGRGRALQQRRHRRLHGDAEFPGQLFPQGGNRLLGV